MVDPVLIQTLETQESLETYWEDIEQDWSLKEILEDISYQTISNNQNLEHQIKEAKNLYDSVYHQRIKGHSSKKYSKVDEPAPTYAEFESLLKNMVTGNRDSFYQKEKVNHMRDLLMQYDVILENNHILVQSEETLIEYNGPTSAKELKKYK